MPAAVFAQSAASGTIIEGTVYDVSNNNRVTVSGATVNINCGGQRQTVSTGANGQYYAVYSTDVCPLGANFSVTAGKGTLGGAENGIVDNRFENLDINIGHANIFMTQVPEFGLIPGAIAALTSGGSLFAFRRMRKA